MMSKLPIYTEVVYKENENGTCSWLGRVYNRVGPARVLGTYNGLAPSRAEALVAAKVWSDETLDACGQYEVTLAQVH